MFRRGYLIQGRDGGVWAVPEGFIEWAGVQRFPPREMDMGYMYDRIYLRGDRNRHILQTTFTFHRGQRDSQCRF